MHKAGSPECCKQEKSFYQSSLLYGGDIKIRLRVRTFASVAAWRLPVARSH